MFNLRIYGVPMAMPGLIAPAAAQQMTPAEYDAAVQEIVDCVTLRAADVEGFLAQEE